MTRVKLEPWEKRAIKDWPNFLRRIFRRRVKLVDLTPYQRLLALTVKK